MIINMKTKQVQTQSGQKGNWMGEDWVIVPEKLEEKTTALSPFCILEHDGETLISIEDDLEARKEWEGGTRTEESIPDNMVLLMQAVLDIDYRLILQEWRLK